MVADLATAGGWSRSTRPRRRCSTGPQRPIVLAAAPTRRGRRRRVAPGSPDLGVMLAVHAAAPPAARAAGRPGGPAGAGDDERQPGRRADRHRRRRGGRAAGGLADAWLTPRPADPRALRRLGRPGRWTARSCRSAAPAATRRCRSRCPSRSPPTLAVGADLKNTFCLAEGRYAWLSQHIGDMDDLATLARVRDAPRQHLRDAHRRRRPEAGRRPAPRLPVRRWARRQRRDRPLVAVQHHHAHVASVMAEHGLDGGRPGDRDRLRRNGLRHRRRRLGRRGADRRLQGIRRFAHLAYVPLPGGDAAVRRPYRMALAHLRAAGRAWDPPLALRRARPAAELGCCRRS